MKIRNGFVSNSSSSSFLIYGVSIRSNEFEKILENQGIDSWELEKKSGLEIIQPCDTETVYIGLSWDSTKDDETRKQFQERVARLILDHMNEKFDLCTHGITDRRNMKVRNGFVSNSSSSSFIVAGIKVRKDQMSDELREELWDKDFRVLSDGDDGVPSGYCVIGKELASPSDDYMEYTELSLASIDENIKDVEAAVGIVGMRGVFTGTRAC